MIACAPCDDNRRGLWWSAHRAIRLAATTAITGLAIDSRRIKSGDLFAALPGARADGHDFARWLWIRVRLRC